MLNAMRRDADALQRYASELIEVANRTVLPWVETGSRYWAEAMLMQGHVQEAMAATRRSVIASGSVGHNCFVTGTYCALAQSHFETGQPEEGLAVIEEALSFVEQSEERHFEAELWRLQAELLTLQANEAQAEASYMKAIAVARRQEARSWELRAATGLARLWKRQGRTEEARELLAGVYGWFTEGFDTPDLKEAKTLLGALDD